MTLRPEGAVLGGVVGMAVPCEARDRHLGQGNRRAVAEAAQVEIAQVIPTGSRSHNSICRAAIALAFAGVPLFSRSIR